MSDDFPAPAMTDEKAAQVAAKHNRLVDSRAPLLAWAGMTAGEHWTARGVKGDLEARRQRFADFKQRMISKAAEYRQRVAAMVCSEYLAHLQALWDTRDFGKDPTYECEYWREAWMNAIADKIERSPVMMIEVHKERGQDLTQHVTVQVDTGERQALVEVLPWDNGAGEDDVLHLMDDLRVRMRILRCRPEALQRLKVTADLQRPMTLRDARLLATALWAAANEAEELLTFEMMRLG